MNNEVSSKIWRLRKKYFYHFPPRLRVSLKYDIVLYNVSRSDGLPFGQFDNEFVS